MPDAPLDRTGLRSGSTPIDEINALPAGTRFGELEILHTVGVGGFGIVYLARDHALEREVAIKEYMPGQLAQRGEGSVVSVRSVSLAETFEIGRRSFVNEARLLARFDHRSLLKVYQFWEANGTAYMAMPFLQGRTFKQLREAISAGQSPALDEAGLRRLLLPLLDALGLLHEAQVYHRDIAPDNILLPEGGGDPILLDFGAARRAISDRTQSFTAILKPSYAPIEQYAEVPNLRQGPWTDVYALGAVLHFMLLGHPPPPATARAVEDDLRPLASHGLSGFSAEFLAAIDWALAVRPQQRPQSMAELRSALNGQLQPPLRSVVPAQVHAQGEDPDRTVVIPRGSRPTEPPPLRPASPTVDLRLETSASPPSPASPAASAASAAAPPAVGGKPAPALLAGGLAALLVVAAAAWWALRPAAPAALPASDAPDVAALAALAASTPASVPVAASAAVPAPVPAPPVSVSDAASASAAVPAAARVPSPALSLPTAASSAPAKAASKPAARPSAPVRGEANRRPGRDPAGVPSLPQGDASLQQPPPAATAQPAVRAPERSAAPASEEPAAPLDPRQACAKENVLMRVWCVDRRCEKPAYAGHAECVRLREIREQRRER